MKDKAYPSLLLLVALLVVVPLAASFAEEAGFKPIFNGQDLDGWDGDPKFWKVEDGAITGETTPRTTTQGNTFLIWRDGELDDFELRLEYRIYRGNSGVHIRSTENEAEWGKWVVGGYQADLEAPDYWSGALYEERFRGTLAKRGDKVVVGENHQPAITGQVGDRDELQSRIKKEDWNEYHILAHGNHFELTINGALTAEVDDEDVEMRRRSGLLALQLHSGPPMKVQFRNIRLKRLELGDKKKLVLVAGKRSHGYGYHEHNAGSLLLKKALDENAPGVLTAIYKDGWPEDPTAFDNADGIMLYIDGGGHYSIPKLEELDALMNKGVGLACIHYAVEVPKGIGGDFFLDWIGGYFEPGWSVNPHWTLKNPIVPKGHPITNGVNPFEIKDEWYYNMRFQPEMKGVTSILAGVPPDRTLNRPEGPHSNNEHVRARKGMLHVVSWAYERPQGGRGFGFTGGHFHWNWANDDFRKIVLNALVWISGGDVPPGGVPSRTPTRTDLEANQDYPPPAENWTEFRGPTGQGLSTTKGLPVSWDGERNVTWKQRIPGKGWSQPVIYDGQVYMTTAVSESDGDAGNQSLRVLRLDAKSGKIVWNKEVFYQDASKTQPIHKKNSHASPSPLTDGKSLFVHYGTTGTARLDVDGNILWTNQELAYDPRHGDGGSPVLTSELLILSCDGHDVQFVVALEREGGKIRWKMPRPGHAGRGFSFTTPLLIEVAGKQQVISPGSDSVCAYDPRDGREIWRVRYSGWSVVPRPLYAHGLVFVCTGWSTPSLLAIEPDGEGDVTDTKVVWQTKAGIPHSTAPIVVGDEIYFVSDNGVGACLDARTGEPRWKQRLGGNHSAAPIHADGKIYFQSEEGEGIVLQAGKEFMELSRNPLEERTLTAYAISGRAFFIRSLEHLYRIEAQE